VTPRPQPSATRHEPARCTEASQAGSGVGRSRPNALGPRTIVKGPNSILCPPRKGVSRILVLDRREFELPPNRIPRFGGERLREVTVWLEAQLDEGGRTASQMVVDHGYRQSDALSGLAWARRQRAVGGQARNLLHGKQRLNAESHLVGHGSILRWTIRCSRRRHVGCLTPGSTGVSFRSDYVGVTPATLPRMRYTCSARAHAVSSQPWSSVAMRASS
jgi:hypothetical protein